MKLKNIANVNELLSKAKLTKVEGVSKLKVVKAAREISKIFEEVKEIEEQIRNSAKDEDFDKYVSKLQKWQTEGENTTLSEEERLDVNQYFAKYTQSISPSIINLSEEDRQTNFEKLTDSEFESFVESNSNWNVNDILLLEDILK
jgi:flagellar biosynthesis chaperone FliJ